MNVLSLFDGIAGARQAFKNAGINVNKYFASEIDKYAIQVAKANHSDIEQIGDINNIDYSSLGEIDLIIGGSPCQGFSVAGKHLNFDDPRSKLFFRFVEAVKIIKPRYFILENVKMKKEWQNTITQQMGVEPILINSALLTAQNRNRLYWCNFPTSQPKDKGILLKDILEQDGDGCIKSYGKYKPRLEKSQCLDANYYKGADNHVQRTLIVRIGSVGKGRQGERVYSTEGKSITLNASSGGPGSNTGLYATKNKNKLIAGWDSIDKDHIRKLTPLECERLQGFPDNYTNCVSNTQRYKALGNAFTVSVIEHILCCMSKYYTIKDLKRI